jgi:hypothetical protein
LYGNPGYTEVHTVETSYYLTQGVVVDNEVYIYNEEVGTAYSSEVEPLLEGGHARYYAVGDPLDPEANRRIFLATEVDQIKNTRRYVYWDSAKTGSERCQTDTVYTVSSVDAELFPDDLGETHYYHEIPGTDLITPGWLRLVRVSDA